jgi:hypothetical protein
MIAVTTEKIIRLERSWDPICKDMYPLLDKKILLNFDKITIRGKLYHEVQNFKRIKSLERVTSSRGSES